MIKLSRTQRRRTDRRIGRVGGSFIGILVVPYALPIGIVLWLLGSVIGLAALVVLILAVVALVPVAGAVAVVGAVTLPVIAVYLLTIGILASAMILTAQRAWDWTLPVRAWIAAGLALRGERVARATVPMPATQRSRTVSTIDAVRRAEPLRARPTRASWTRRLARDMPRARPAGSFRFLSGDTLPPRRSLDVRETSVFRGSCTRCGSGM